MSYVVQVSPTSRTVTFLSLATLLQTSVAGGNFDAQLYKFASSMGAGGLVGATSSSPLITNLLAPVASPTRAPTVKAFEGNAFLNSGVIAIIVVGAVAMIAAGSIAYYCTTRSKNFEKVVPDGVPDGGGNQGNLPISPVPIQE